MGGKSSPTSLLESKKQKEFNLNTSKLTHLFYCGTSSVTQIIRLRVLLKAAESRTKRA